MPTYSYGVRMTDAKAAEIIRRAFPKWWQNLPFRRKRWMSVHTVCDAILHARIKCANESLEACVKWAYDLDKRRHKC